MTARRLVDACGGTVDVEALLILLAGISKVDNEASFLAHHGVGVIRADALGMAFDSTFRATVVRCVDERHDHEESHEGEDEVEVFHGVEKSFDEEYQR